jgi:F0F1-type ATP synthase membrane subunit a
MVIIEIVRRLIRPITLSVRLAANMVAGHLLMALISGPISVLRFFRFFLILSGLLLLTVLELAVSFIQAYVFRTLMSLYIIEVNSPNF